MHMLHWKICYEQVSLIQFFSNQPSLYNLLMHMFMLDLSASPHSALYEITSNGESQNDTLLNEIVENEVDDKLYIIFL